MKVANLKLKVRRRTQR